MTETAPKLKMSLALGKTCTLIIWNSKCIFPWEKKKSKMMIRFQDQPPKIYADYNFIVVYSST